MVAGRKPAKSCGDAHVPQTPSDPGGALAGFEPGVFPADPEGALAGFEFGVFPADPEGALAGFESRASSEVEAELPRSR